MIFRWKWIPRPASQCKHANVNNLLKPRFALSQSAAFKSISMSWQIHSSCLQSLCVGHQGNRTKIVNCEGQLIWKGRALERFHNSRGLSCVVQGGIFLWRMPLESSDFGVKQLWNRSKALDSSRAFAAQRENARKPFMISEDLRGVFVHLGGQQAQGETTRVVPFQNSLHHG